MTRKEARELISGLTIEEKRFLLAMLSTLIQNPEPAEPPTEKDLKEN